MNSPFTDTSIRGIKNHDQWENSDDEITLKSPLIHPDKLNVESQVIKPEIYDQQSLSDFETGNAHIGEELIEHQSPPATATVKFGDTVLAFADNSIAVSPDFFDPSFSLNPLLHISSADRQKTISDNFKVGEFVRARQGAHTWNFARIDPSLVTNLQSLRSFINKEVTIIDGYYPPKYLKTVLKVTDPGKISLNPHVSGRGVKLSVRGYNNTMREIAVAAIVACKEDLRSIKISFGDSTLSLYVKQPYNAEKKITSYIKDEEIKVNNENFCRDFINILIDSEDEYERNLNSATASLARAILTQYYMKRWTDDWKPAIHDVISLMFGKSKTKNPGVILFCLAYTSFGCLYRYYLKDKTKDGIRTVTKLISMVTPGSTGNTGPGSFSKTKDLPDKTEFIRRYMNLAVKTPGEVTAVFKSFFDWQYDKNDKDFFDAFNTEIRIISKKFGYTDDPFQQLPVGGTKHDLRPTPANPDKPPYDSSGKYWYDFPEEDTEYVGYYLLLNQAGNYVSGKIGGVFKKALRSYEINRKTILRLKDSVQFFYGKMDTDGKIKGFLYPQKIVEIRKNSLDESLNLKITDNSTNPIQIFEQTLNKRSAKPTLSAQIVESYIKSGILNENLAITLAWAYPLPAQMKALNAFLSKSEKEVTQALVDFYNPTSDIPNVRRNLMENAVNKLYNNHYYYQLTNYREFVSYFTRFYYSKSNPWQPRKDKELLRKVEWIKRMLRDFRDLRKTEFVEERFKDLYNFFGVDTRIPPVGYKYKINIKTTTAGVGPFAVTSGSIDIENVTNYVTYPKAEKWKDGNKTSFHIRLVQASVSFLAIDKWRPKISARFQAEAETQETPTLYCPDDFSDAAVDMQEWTAYEFSAGKNTGANRTEISGGYTKRLLTLSGPGKAKLEFEQLEDTPFIPDSVTVQPKEDDHDSKIFDFSLPNVTFYKGYIGEKAITKSTAGDPLADKFTAAYQLTSFTFFKHDEAPLQLDAINAVGKMCSEELAALTDENTIVDITGHADASGEAKYNKDLSIARAENVKQAIKDRLGIKLRATINPVKGMGEDEANKLGQWKEKNAWRRRVFVIINGKAVLMLGE